MCETNGVYLASLRSIGGWSSSVRTGRARAANDDAADGDEADGDTADGDEA